MSGGGRHDGETCSDWLNPGWWAACSCGWKSETVPSAEGADVLLAEHYAEIRGDGIPVRPEVAAASRAMADQARAEAAAAVGLVLQVRSIVESGERLASEARTLGVDPDSFHANAFRRIAALLDTDQ